MKKHLDLLQLICVLVTLLVFLLEGFILYKLISKGFPHITYDFLFNKSVNSIEDGIYLHIVGNVFLVFIMILFVFPIGVGTGIYLQEYVNNSFIVSILRMSIYNLAGVPSIVYGLFGFVFFIQFIGKGIDLYFFGGNLVLGQPIIFWASLTLAFLTLPTVVVTTEEAIKSIPRDIKEASYALGASRFQTIRKIIIPNAFSQILTGIVLAIGRGAGEVAPILFTGVAYYTPGFSFNLNDQFMHLGYFIYNLFTQSINFDQIEGVIYASVLVFFTMIFILNIIVTYIRYKIIKRKINNG